MTEIKKLFKHLLKEKQIQLKVIGKKNYKSKQKETSQHALQEGENIPVIQVITEPSFIV